jgi:hypothetical protein
VVLVVGKSCSLESEQCDDLDVVASAGLVAEGRKPTSLSVVEARFSPMIRLALSCSATRHGFL